MKSWWTAVAVFAAAMGFASSEARAQVYGINSTDMIAYQSGLRIDRSMLAGPLASSTRSVRMDGSGMQTGPEVREINLLGSRSGLMVEMARLTPDGQFVRPRLLIGRHSDELRNWMHAAGVSADRCMLPLVRSRLKRAPETGKVGVAFLVSARCSFY
jgi:hypothetical protein